MIMTNDEFERLLAKTMQTLNGFECPGCDCVGTLKPDDEHGGYTCIWCGYHEDEE
jgi:hypothetical protein